MRILSFKKRIGLFYYYSLFITGNNTIPSSFLVARSTLQLQLNDIFYPNVTLTQLTLHTLYFTSS